MTTSVEPAAPSRRSAGRTGPPPLAPALSWAVLTVAAAALFPGTRPDTTADATLLALQASSTATISAMLLTASAIPLLVWSGTVHQRFGVLGVRVAGPTLGLVGGVLAAVALAVSGLVGWTAATVAPLGDPLLVHALTRLAFAAGGPLFAAGLGLAIAGTAVPGLLGRLLPRPLAVAGLVLAACGAVSPLVLVLPVLSPVLPVVRFGGLLWLLAVSVLLPRQRSRTSTPGRPSSGLGDRGSVH